MKTYPTPMVIVLPYAVKSAYRSLLVLMLVLCSWSGFSQELVFKLPLLETPLTTAGKDGAVYRFSNVTTNIDALVKIVRRSHTSVKLSNIDLPALITGYENAWQPQIDYNNGSTPNGNSDWHMEFDISFVKKATNQPIVINKADVTTLDLDGNDKTLKEYATFYNMTSYTFESNTQVTTQAVSDPLTGYIGNQAGRQFVSPSKQYSNINYSETKIMVTTVYQNVSSFRVRLGGKSTARNNDINRMYSLWFKSFTYQAPVSGVLPVELNEFNANKKNDSKILLNWTTSTEVNVSHFVIERSFDGVNYNDAGIVFAAGNSTTTQRYSFTDDLKSNSKGVIQYRLRIVDANGRYAHSLIRLIRSGEQKTATVQAFPNPVVNELRVSLPTTWQEKQVAVDIYNNNGQLMKRTVFNKASQTESMNVSELGSGLYVVKVSNGMESAVHRIAKAK